MKKLYYIILIFLIVFVGFFYFTTTPYFFHKYIAPNIKSYHFSYKSVKGTLFNGFKVEHLEYKDKELSSFVELQFNPFALLEKKVLVNKLTLKDVNKEVLKELIDDFKSDNNQSKKESASFITLDFVLKNIDITFKPFSFESLKVYKNKLAIKSVSFINGKLNLDKNYYYYDTNLGLLEFEGRFQKGVLYIDKIAVKNFDLQKALEVLKNLENNSSDQKQAEGKILFWPKKLIIKELFASLKPFKYNSLDITQAKVQGEEIEFNLLEKKLYKATLNLNLLSAISDFSTKFILKDKKLTIPNIELALLNSNELLSFLQGFSTKKTKEKNTTATSINPLSYIMMEEIRVKNIDILIKQLSLSKKESIKKALFNAKELYFDLPSKQLKLEDSEISIDSTLAFLKMKASIQKEIAIQSFLIQAKSGERIKKFIQELNSSNEDSGFDFMGMLPAKLSIQNAQVELKELEFKPYHITKAQLELHKALIDMNKTALEQADVLLYNDSNWGKAFLKGKIKNDIFYAQGEANITQNLLDEYSIPLNAKNLKPIKVKGAFSLDDLNITASLTGKDIFKTLKNIDILSSTNRVYYNYHNSKTIWNIDALLSHPLLLKAKLQNHLEFINDKFSYKGVLLAKEKIQVNKQLAPFLKDLKLQFKGDSQGIDLLAQTKTLEGKLFAKAYKKGILELKNRKTIDIEPLISLKKAKIKKLLIEAPVDFNHLSDISGTLFVDSTIMKLKGRWNYKKDLELKGSLLDSELLPKKFKRASLFPANFVLKVGKEVELNLQNRLLNALFSYNISNEIAKAQLKTKSLKIDGEGNSKKFVLKLLSSSLAQTIKEIQKLYPFTMATQVDGKISATVNSNFKEYALELTSNEIKVLQKRDSKSIKNIALKALYKDNTLFINSYKLNFQNLNFFASEPSKIVLEKNAIVISKFIINNSATLAGRYNFTNMKGKLSLKAKGFAFENQDYKVKTNLDLKITALQERYTIDGIVNIIQATIKKNLERSNGVDSDDIIIIQKEAQKKSSFFVKNIKLNLKINSQKGIIYAQDGSYFIAYPKLKIKKEFNSFTKLDGVIQLDKKSFYIFKGKKIRLKRGRVTFKGNSSLAYLNIVMYYKGRDYDIYITITGDSSRPVIYFSSNPPLTKEQILAYLLFNDTAAAGTHSQESMLNLVGSALAQSFFGSIGLKIDKLSIKENGFSIGKAINDKVIIYYNQEGETPSIKTRIDITNSIHSIIEVGEGKQSADIIFSKEY